MKPKVIGRASREMPPEVAMTFLSRAGIWDELSKEDRDAFVMRGEILQSRGGEKLAKLIALRGAENVLSAKYGEKKS